MEIKETIVVEGKYDKIRLQSLVKANIIQTDGFQIFKDAGIKIRNFIKSNLAGKNIKHALIPSIKGKEKRKEKPGKEGLLGVEGMRDEALLQALSMTFYEEKEEKEKISKSDFYLMGITGGPESRAIRDRLKAHLGLPQRLSANMLLDVLNVLYDRDEFIELFEKFLHIL